MTNTERTELELRNQLVTMAAQIATLTTHNNRLNKELPLMRKENRKLMGFIQDAHAYLRHSFREGTRQDIILTTLAHDLKGLANDDRCFCPRVTGYDQEGK
jgi:hypothetical protein